MTRAAIYTRVSTEEQASHGVSLHSQADKCSKYADLHEMRVVETFCDEGYSAKNLNRPAMQNLLHWAINGGVDAVIITKLDRITRSTRDLGELLDIFSKNKVGLHGVVDKLDTSSAGGMLVTNVMCSVAQWEREVTSERVRDGHHHIRYNRGYHVSRPPYGWEAFKVDGVPGLVLSPLTGALEKVRTARDLRDTGASYATIARLLDLNDPKAALRIIKSPLPDEMVFDASAGGYRWPV